MIVEGQNIESEERMMWMSRCIRPPKYIMYIICQSNITKYSFIHAFDSIRNNCRNMSVKILCKCFWLYFVCHRSHWEDCQRYAWSLETASELWEQRWIMPADRFQKAAVNWLLKFKDRESSITDFASGVLHAFDSPECFFLAKISPYLTCSVLLGFRRHSRRWSRLTFIRDFIGNH